MNKVYVCNINSPLGKLTLSSDGEKLTGLWFENQKYFKYSIRNKSVKNVKVNDLPIFKETQLWLKEYFDGKIPNRKLPLNPDGTYFQKIVWEILNNIPYGKTMTYKEISESIKKKLNLKNMSSQAVGGAVGHNPISIITPCHRVVGSNKSLTGFAAGIDTKIKLLELEGLDMSTFKIPN